MSCAKYMYNNEGGVKAFYKSFGPTWMRFAPFTTIQLVSWEALRKCCGIEGL